MTIREAITYGTKTCDLLDTQLLLAHVLKEPRIFVLTHNDELTPAQISEFQRLVDMRASHVPLQYILGKCEFYGLEFEVNENVLIPRADTETLVDAVLQNLPQYVSGNLPKDGSVTLPKDGPATLPKDGPVTLHKDGPVTLLEIGTGSGCISIALAKHAPNLRIDAMDISQPSLEVAAKNAVTHNVEINFIHADIFDKTLDKTYDVIVSNPPYIETDIIGTLQPEVANHEPRTALDGGADGLDFYRKIAQIHVKNFTAVELGHTQFESVSEIFTQNGFREITAYHDLAGVDRVLIAKTLVW